MFNSEESDLEPNFSNNEESEDEIQRKEIRSNLSSLSFEELIKLKDKLGSKVYNETVYGVSGKLQNEKSHNITVKRDNKNRPREISSKIRPKRIRAMLSTKDKINNVTPRDPRFDSSLGEFDKEKFTQNYKFINEIKDNERKELENEYNECTGSERKKTIKLLIQRMDNQVRELNKINSQKEKDQTEKRDIKEKVKQGLKPVYKKKSVKTLENLIEKYEELKKTNRLEKHLQKKSKKLKAKDRKIIGKIKS